MRRGASHIKRWLLVDAEINNKDESYEWFLHWMRAHQQHRQSPSGNGGSRIEKNANSRLTGGLIQRIKPRMHHFSVDTQKIQHPNGSVDTTFSLVPGPGRHILRYKNAFFMINRMREAKVVDLQIGKPWETITITGLYSQRDILQQVLAEAHALAQQSTEGKTIVYMARTTSWERFGEPRRKRPLASVILDRGIRERIVSDVKQFLNSGSWYHDRGIPYRRGYLLHGPPGSGKSSFIQALAGELDYNIAIINLSERGMTDDRLNFLLTVIPQRTLVLLEDADAAFANRRVQTDAHGYQGANVTFSGLLNALDGVASTEQRIHFLTTNHLERLDSALVRPGRVDLSVRLGDVTRWQSEKLWDRFYGGLDEYGVYKAQFLSRLGQLGIIEDERGRKRNPELSTSAAALQGLFLYNKDNPEGAISMIPGLIPENSMRTDEDAVDQSSNQISGMQKS